MFIRLTTYYNGLFKFITLSCTYLLILFILSFRIVDTKSLRLCGFKLFLLVELIVTRHLISKERKDLKIWPIDKLLLVENEILKVNCSIKKMKKLDEISNFHPLMILNTDFGEDLG